MNIPSNESSKEVSFLGTMLLQKEKFETEQTMLIRLGVGRWSEDEAVAGLRVLRLFDLSEYRLIKNFYVNKIS